MEEKHEIRAAIVGCGSIAGVHAAAIHGQGGARLAAVCDIVPRQAERLARDTNAAVYHNLEDMLAKGGIDVLHICTPHHLHVAMAEAAAGRGVAVFTEKPPCTTREEALRFYALEGKAPVGVCFQNRYNPCTRYVAGLLQTGRPGRILGGRALVTWKREAPYYTGSNWRGKWNTEGGGALINQAIHTLDLLVGFLGRPQAVEATMANHRLKSAIEVEDTLEAFLAYEDCSAVFYATNAYPANSPVLLELLCENAVLRLEDGMVTLRWQDGTVETNDLSQTPNSPKAYWGNGHRACIADFYRCLRTGSPYANGISSVKNTMDTVLAIYRSGRENKPVFL